MNTMYTPKPLDTAAVVLPKPLEDLLEKLAENTHEVWSATRLSQGWTFGPARDDAAKEHPCLIPYAELPESEKVYDRATAGETLKAILLLGYRIEGGDHPWSSPNPESVAPSPPSPRT